MRPYLKPLCDVTALTTGWRLCLTPPNAFATPDMLSSVQDWINAEVPGTAAAALEKAGRFDRLQPQPIEDHDVWYAITPPNVGDVVLQLDGLATLAEVWLGARLLITSDNMFLCQAIDVSLDGNTPLALCFRSLGTHLQKPVKRARWRPAMIKPSTLNAVRTTILGHVQSWCPAIPPIGPWRDISLVAQRGDIVLSDLELRGDLDGIRGFLICKVSIRGLSEHDHVRLRCAAQTTELLPDGDGAFTGCLMLDNIAPWWPHTHGTPSLHAVELMIGESLLALGNVGFRHITVDQGSDGDGFTVVCNGVPIFCRGACWTPPDLLTLSSTREQCEPLLTLAVEAGMNMLRVGGTMVYEGTAFYQLCDQLGILVWQDFMFANFDYPAGNPDFAQAVEIEASQFLRATAHHACLAILCGGSEVYQQAAMMGLPMDIWRNPIFDGILRRVSADIRPDVVYVPNSPSGGVLPFVVNQGVSHYYGVGAYMRPLHDARRAGVRFTSECLAFANIPDEISIRSSLNHESWCDVVPRDAGASWDFADVRDHYLDAVFEGGSSLKSTDPARYREASRAVVAHVMRETFSEWRHPRSSNAGGLIWFMSDLAEGSGWGVIDSSGRPKSAWYGLKDCLQPRQILLTDEGVNGLDIHVLNECESAFEGQVRLTCLRDGHIRVVDATRAITLDPRAGTTLPAVSLFGAFFDTTYTYRFGPPSHDVVFAELIQDDVVISASAYFPLGQSLERDALGLQAVTEEIEGSWFLLISTGVFARFVQIEDEHLRPSENWFHLAPHAPRRVRLEGQGAHVGTPRGRVSALNATDVVTY